MLLISHWNIGGVGRHDWNRAAVAVLVGTTKPDVICLSELKNYEGKDFPDYIRKVLPPNEGPPKHRGLSMAYKKHLTPMNIQESDPNESIEYLSMDFQLTNGTHRVVLVYHQHKQEEANKPKCPDHITKFLTGVLTSSGVDFIHLLGDFNLEETKLKESMRSNKLEFVPLLNPDWKTHGSKKLDLIFSCAVGKELKTSVMAHHPMAPSDLVRNIEPDRPLDIGDVRIVTKKREDGKKTVEYFEGGSKYDYDPPKKHQMLLLHVGDNINSSGGLFCTAESSEACCHFDEQGQRIHFNPGTHTGLPENIRENK